VARSVGMPVVFLQNGWDAQYQEAGGPCSPNWYKSNALKTMRHQPELQGRFLAKGGWDYEMVSELKPQPGDLLVPKTRYSGFFNSTLDSTLRARGVRHLVFTGIATVVLEDATHQLGSPAIQAASIYNIETFFGWVASVEDFCATFAPA
jgi:ureidoacrylate peracid hydrolase